MRTRTSGGGGGGGGGAIRGNGQEKGSQSRDILAERRRERLLGAADQRYASRLESTAAAVDAEWEAEVKCPVAIFFFFFGVCSSAVNYLNERG